MKQAKKFEQLPTFESKKEVNVEEVRKMLKKKLMELDLEV